MDRETEKALRRAIPNATPQDSPRVLLHRDDYTIYKHNNNFYLADDLSGDVIPISINALCKWATAHNVPHIELAATLYSR